MYTSRPFRDEADYEHMRELLVRSYPLASPPLNLLLGELDWWRSISNLPGVMSRVQLWFEATGSLVAFVWPGNAQIDLFIHPAHRALEPRILALAEAEFVQAQAGEAPLGFHFWSYEQDTLRNALLEERGYRRDDDEFLACHRLALTGDEPTPHRPLPAGYTLRAFAGESEIESRVEAHRSAFAPSTMTVDKHRKVMASPTYREDLDIVCKAPDGAVAACTIVWLDATNGVGIFEPVACHAEHQRRGLASAVMRKGLRRLHALGAHTAHVMSHRDDSAGAHTYRALGFEAIGRLYRWTKELAPAGSAAPADPARTGP